MLSLSHKVSRLVPANRERPQTTQTTPSASTDSLSSEYTAHLRKSQQPKKRISDKCPRARVRGKRTGVSVVFHVYGRRELGNAQDGR
jgi:hypothetical protein